MSNGDTNRERLDSWKEIATYLGHDVRTVMRWERNRGLPVHRIPGGQRQTVFAYRTEVDQWLGGMSSSGEPGMPEALLISQQPSEPVIETVSDEPPPKAFTWRRIAARIVLGAVASTLLLGIAMRSMPFRLASRRFEPVQVKQLTNDGAAKDGLVTDGSRLYFSEHTGAKISLASMPVTGGEVRIIDTPFTNVVPLDISPNGNELLVRVSEGFEPREDDQKLSIVSVSGNASRPVGTVLCHSAVWSPDGRAIAYASGNELYITLDEGRSNQLLATFELVPTSLQWLADGRRIRFLLRNAMTSESKPVAYELTLNNNLTVESSRSLQIPLEDCCQWSAARATNTFFVGSNNSKENRFWRLTDTAVSSSKPAELTTILGRVGTLAASPEGKRLFVLSASPARGDLIRLDPSTRSFTPYLPGIPAIYVDFSRDGRRIAYVRQTDQTLWVSRADGGDPRELRLPDQEVMLPRWSPDGTQIAFSSRHRGGAWRIFIVPSDGGSAREASTGSDRQGAPTWSPDGKFLVYGNVECQVSNSCAIHQIELATGKVSVLPGSEGLQTARWSPDGRYIAAMRQPDQLVVFDVQNHRWKRLLDQANGNDVSWSRDSRHLYTQSSKAGASELLRVSVTGGKTERDVELTPLATFTGQLSPWFSLAPDASVILLHDMSASEIYRVDIQE